jgi:signal transduction histidine kinase
VPFLVLLVALSYVPYASQRATVDAALVREQARHRLLVTQVAARVQADAEHDVGAVLRLAHALERAPLDDPSTVAEMGTAWDLLSSLPDVDSLVVVDAAGRPLHAYGPTTELSPEAHRAFRSALQDAIRDTRPVDAFIWSSGQDGLRMTVHAAVRGPDSTNPGAVALTVRVDRMIARLFHGASLESGVSFTIIAADGSVLLHSGLAPMAAEGGPGAGACADCHSDPNLRERMMQRQAGGGRERIADVDRVVAYAPVSIAGQVWMISASTPVTEVVRPVAQQAIVSLFFTLTIVIVLLLLGILLRRGHIRQIELEHELAAKEKLLGLAREKERLDGELEASRRMATIGEMVARVAHEVKNPLQYIGTAADLLASTTKDEAASSLIGDMRTGVRTLNAIITELLDFSRPMRLDVAPVDLSELAAEVARRVVPADAEALLVLEPGLPEVPCDGYKIRQILENLVRNAVDALATGPGAVRRIELSTAREDPWVVVRVRDSGRGIRPEDLPRIWEPFFTSKTHGSGLGLAVVRRTIDAHRGEVRVESVPGEGTTFSVLLRPDRPGPGAEPRR